jgi:hypothetical protein
MELVSVVENIQKIQGNLLVLITIIEGRAGDF